ncbi:MAG: hypothetical protein H7833_03515 [Magnetococcus sp. DMHC-1]
MKYFPKKYWVILSGVVLAISCVGGPTPPPQTKVEAPPPPVTHRVLDAPAPSTSSISSIPQPENSLSPAKGTPGTGSSSGQGSSEGITMQGVNRVQFIPLGEDGIHDPESPGLKNLQNPAHSLGVFPPGQWGEVDWMRALLGGHVKPRADLEGKGDMQLLDLNIIMTNTKAMPHVRFPHNSHTQWLACSNCHPEIFKPEKGTNNITMESIFRGRACGTCHGRVAFSVYICQRCHSVPHEGSPGQWW